MLSKIENVIFFENTMYDIKIKTKLLSMRKAMI